MTDYLPRGSCRQFMGIAVFPAILFLVLSSAVGEEAKGQAEPAAQYIDAALSWCDRAERNIERFTEVGELIADKHLKGGAIGTWWGNQSLGPELLGRAGNIVHIGFDRPWKKDRGKDEKKHDVGLLGFDSLPDKTDMSYFDKAKQRGCYMIIFCPKEHPGMADVIRKSNVVFDTGFGTDDNVVTIGGGTKVGHANHVANAIHGWALMAETVAALTRRGKMPTMWKSYSYPDGKEWGGKYFGKKQFHDDYKIGPQPPGKLGLAYLHRVRGLLQRLKIQELADIRTAGGMIADELKAGRKTVVSWAGHMPTGYVGRRDDVLWCRSLETHFFLKSQSELFQAEVKDNGLLLRLGYHGLHPNAPPLFRQKKQRVIMLSTEHPDPAFQTKDTVMLHIDLGWAFGDACVSVEGYPFPLFAPSGIMQAVAYEAIHAEVLSRTR